MDRTTDDGITSMKRRIKELLEEEKKQDIFLLIKQKDCKRCKIGKMSDDSEKFMRSLRAGFVLVETKVIETKKGLVDLHGGDNQHRIPIGEVLAVVTGSR